MNGYISHDEILAYLYRTKECLDESESEPERRYFRHCIMAVINLGVKCHAVAYDDVYFYKDIFKEPTLDKSFDLFWR